MHQAFRCLKIVFFIIDVKRLPIFVVVICYKLVPTEFSPFVIWIGERKFGIVILFSVTVAILFFIKALLIIVARKIMLFGSCICIIAIISESVKCSKCTVCSIFCVPWAFRSQICISRFVVSTTRIGNGKNIFDIIWFSVDIIVKYITCE